jgi:sulfhydrogenase subunit beta (sulfur reductase)
MAQSPVPKATRLVSKVGLGRWLAALAAGNTVMAPVQVDGKPLFTALAKGQESSLDLESVHTVNSPKGGLLPQTEPLVSFSQERDAQGAPTLAVGARGSGGPTVLFGVRPCDAAAMDIFDKVFLTGDFVDDQYKARRDKVTIVSVACPAPARSCFCSSFGLSPGAARGADVVLYGRSGPGRAEAEAYFAVAYTDRGAALLGSEASKASGLAEIPAAESQKVESVVNSFRELKTALGTKLGQVDVAAKLDGLFESPYWEKAAGRCLSCGTCTFVCPTCYCFGVADTGTGGHGVRFRYWDSCKFPQFLTMAGGHNPRPAKKMRTRQRFLHKLNYGHHRYGEYLCVGCGRCVESCPVGLHLPQVAGDVRGL